MDPRDKSTVHVFSNVLGESLASCAGLQSPDCGMPAPFIYGVDGPGWRTGACRLVTVSRPISAVACCLPLFPHIIHHPSRRELHTHLYQPPHLLLCGFTHTMSTHIYDNDEHQ